MSMQTLSSLLGWSALINYLILLFWWMAFTQAHDLMFRVHRRWFWLSVEDFDRTHYVAMAAFKILVLVFNLAPYLALRILA